MYCRKCGNELKEDAKFCDKCGTKTEGIHFSKKQIGAALLCLILVVVAVVALIPKEDPSIKLLQEHNLYNANKGDSIEEVKKIKGLKFLDQIELEEDVKSLGDTRLAFEGNFFGEKAEFDYYFKDNKLNELVIYVYKSNLKESNKIEEVYQKIEDGVTEVYGEPISKEEKGHNKDVYIDIEWERKNFKVRLRAYFSEKDDFRIIFRYNCFAEQEE